MKSDRNILVALALLICAPAHADRTALRRAKALFDKAELEYRLGNFERALRQHKAALRLARRPSLMFNIAQCYRYLKNNERAIFFYQLYLSDWKRQHPREPLPPNADEVQEYIAALRRSQTSDHWPADGRLRLRGLPDGAEVRIDGETRGRARRRPGLSSGGVLTSDLGEAPGW